MANAGHIYNFDSHGQATSTGTADVKTLTGPASAVGFLLTCRTNLAYVSFDGTDPTSSTHSIDMPAGAVAALFPFTPALLAGLPIVKVVSSAAGNAVVSVVWLD